VNPQDYISKGLSAASGYKSYGVAGTANVDLSPNRPNPAAKPDFFGNIGKSVAGVGQSIVDFGRDTLRDNSISKLPQVFKSIQDTGFNLGPINIKGKNSVVSAQLAKRSSDALKKLQAGSINKKQFDSEMKDINNAFDELSKKSSESAARLKDASQYNKQFAANATIGTIAATGLEQIAGKAVATVAGKEATANAFSTGLKGFGKGVASEIGVPGMGLTERVAVNQGGNLLSGAAKFVGRTGMNLLDTSNFTAPGSFSAGNTAMNATSLIPGGPLGLISKASTAAGKVVKNTLYDSHGLFDLVKLKGGKTINEAFDVIKKSDPTMAPKLEKVLKQVQDYNLQAFKGDKKAAADNLAEYIGKKNLSQISLEDFVKEQQRFISADRKINGITSKLKEGETIVNSSGEELSPDKLKSLGAVKSSSSEVDAAIKAFKESSGSVMMDPGLAKFRLDYPGFFRNKQNERIMNDIAREGLTGEAAAKYARGKLRGTQELMILAKDGTMRPVSLPGGYFMGVRNGTAKFSDAGSTADIEKGKKALLGGVGRKLEGIGLSTQESGNQGRVYKQIKEEFVNKVESVRGTNGEIPGDVLFRKLEDISSKPGVTDVRQLKASEIEAALGVSTADSKMILKAVKESFLSIPLKDRGLAAKVMDINTAKNPLAAPYSRIQGIARYEKNPSFRLQENIETRLGIGALAESSPKFGHDYTETRNILKNEHIFTSGYANEGAGEGVSHIAAKISRDQERTVSAGIEALAAKSGQSVQQFVTNPKNAEIMDNIRAVVQYPNKGLTSSNFMKALNLVAFPARYNIKVTQLAFKSLAQKSGIEQVAVINALNNFNTFLESDKGIKWKSDNSELLGLLQYYTPVGSVEYVHRLLTGKMRNLKDVGSIGGLPFGVISQVLQGQGVFKGDSPYLDPKTGEIVPDKIPADTKARLEQALTDIVGTMFTFPGRMVNAPSKSSISKKIVETGTFGSVSGGKYDSVERGTLTPEQQRIQSVLKAPNQAPKSLPRGFVPKSVSRLSPASVPSTTPKASKARKVKPKFLARPF
jgi:hypothetical protein